MKIEAKSRNEKIGLPFKDGITLFLKREDQLHPAISGNKYRKLKYNLLAAKEQQVSTLLTFGGAYSNHIAATAAAGAAWGFKTIGVIRGQELVAKFADNPTLAFAQNCGMQFKFLDRKSYRNRSETAFLNGLRREFGNFYALPEGGTNKLAVKGCTEILDQADKNFDYICVSAGTGGTAAGLIKSAKTRQKVLVFPALKGDFLRAGIEDLSGLKDNWQLITDYHFGGYGKIKPELITFINQFSTNTGILLDPVYTGKMLFGIFDLLKKGFFEKKSSILAIHTGGLQGIEGMNKKLQQKGLQLIETNEAY